MLSKVVSASIAWEPSLDFFDMYSAFPSQAGQTWACVKFLVAWQLCWSALGLFVKKMKP